MTHAFGLGMPMKMWNWQLNGRQLLAINISRRRIIRIR